MADTNDKAVELRALVLERFTASIDAVGSWAGSPIESLLYWALLANDPMIPEVADSSFSRCHWFSVSGGLSRIAFRPQWEIDAGGHRYRVDFYARTATVGPTADGGNQTIAVNAVIECDGHDFHERTKEQARRDRQRDRDLQLAGYTVLRFPGSEIFRDPTAVAAEITDSIDTLLTERYEAAHAAWREARARQGQK